MTKPISQSLISPILEKVPNSLKNGINILNNHSVAWVLFAPNIEWVYLIGEFNNWSIDAQYLMKKSPEDNRFWLIVNHLDPNMEYAYLYSIHGNITMADPFSEKVLDPHHDCHIPEKTYPRLKKYPPNPFGGIVSVFQINETKYSWKNTNFKRPHISHLVIYELLVRDFVPSRTFLEVVEHLPYLLNLGINAIELLPINEFTANISWGYNPTFYTATDKFYGSKNDLKYLIDKCHENGIAVILDIVMNHADKDFPYLKAYWDNQKPAKNNPFFNRKATHPYSVFYDFNHESPFTQYYFDQVLCFWLNEYKIDGFRFDLSKGFTQKNTFPNNVAEWSAYDATRISLLKRFYDTIRTIDADCYLILEHFADNQEEKELAEYGFLLWSNQNTVTKNLLKGKNDSYEWTHFQNKTWTKPHSIAYMESHDEERIAVEGLKKYSEATVFQRIKACIALLFTYPGPKMLWQFGELGYDISINDNGRTGTKPLGWHYLKEKEREKLYDFYATMIHLKTSEKIFFDGVVKVHSDDIIKQISLKNEEMEWIVIANFGNEAKLIELNFDKIGTWFDIFSGESFDISTNPLKIQIQASAFHVFTSKKISINRQNLVPCNKELKNYLN